MAIELLPEIEENYRALKKERGLTWTYLADEFAKEPDAGAQNVSAWCREQAEGEGEGEKKPARSTKTAEEKAAEAAAKKAAKEAEAAAAKEQADAEAKAAADAKAKAEADAAES